MSAGLPYLSSDRDRTENLQGRLHLHVRFVYTHCLHINCIISMMWTEGDMDRRAEASWEGGKKAQKRAISRTAQISIEIEMSHMG